ncbi:hypothetical protein JCM10212_005307 [Sporobolomyces blumeae]
MSESPAPEQSGQSTPSVQDSSHAATPQAPATQPTSTSTSTSTSAPAPPAPSPLDHLSPTDLRNKLDQGRKELRLCLEKKRRLDRELSVLETSIYAFEGSYLSDSLFPPSAASNAASTAAAQFGNIIRGYDSYLKAPSASSGDRNKRARGAEGVNDRERMFSASSSTYPKAVELRQAELAAMGAGALAYGGPGGGSGGGVESASEEDSITSIKRKRNRH